MMTVAQMNSLQEQKFRQQHRDSLKSHPMSMAEQLAAPKASYAELFYDLFFVASLTSFGTKHEITQDQAIASYVAFFTVLW
jgi:low temperature requirement protein LtrA